MDGFRLDCPGDFCLGILAANCLTFPHGAVLCNPSTDVVTLVTPTGTFQWDATGYTLPGGHRLERVLG